MQPLILVVALLSAAKGENPLLNPKLYTVKEMYGDMHFGCGPVLACQEKCFKALLASKTEQLNSLPTVWAAYFELNQGADCSKACGPLQSEVIESRTYQCMGNCDPEMRKCRHMYTGQIKDPERIRYYRCADLWVDVCYDDCLKEKNKKREQMFQSCAQEKKEYEQKSAEKEQTSPIASESLELELKSISLAPIARRLLKKPGHLKDKKSEAVFLKTPAKPTRHKTKKEVHQSRLQNHGNRQQYSAQRKLYGQSNHQSYNRAHKGHTHPKQ